MALGRALGLRVAALLAAPALACAACSGDPEEAQPDPSAPLTEIAVECDRFADVAQRIAEAQTKLYDGKESPEDAATVDELVAELDALKEEAPDDVDDALTNLGEGFRTAQQLLARPDEADGAQLAELSPELAEDSETVTAWIVGQCKE